jgi:hypothetical protein
MFHISQLKKCLQVPEEQIPMEDLSASEDLSYQEYPGRSRCARCNGVTTLRKKLLGREKRN